MDNLYYKKLIALFENSKFTQLSYKDSSKFINLKKSATSNTNNSYDEIACTKEDFIPYFIKSNYVCKVITDDDLFRPYIKLNQYVNKGDCIALLSYLNLTMSLISPVSGVVSEILVTNNQMVEYGQVMFIIHCLKNRKSL